MDQSLTDVKPVGNANDDAHHAHHTHDDDDNVDDEDNEEWTRVTDV